MEMKTKVLVRVIGEKLGNGLDEIIASKEFDYFNLDEIDTCISQLIDFVVRDLVDMKAKGVGLGDDPQISLVLSAEDVYIRPSVHLSKNTINKIASIGASFDFDPYT
ncbi:hypothetical protein [Lysobacter sp. Root690]|uniref:hypothetical protein n=1 Tax=Lysobacter sp. Root690 TaxID=1736588 RepID=UPI000701A0D9|nr:hypothetical protein [Lysobacter sp. Root690]KRB02563.1 hypothetical protein ASD86_23935 [Lysobacter sp. Root690]